MNILKILNVLICIFLLPKPSLENGILIKNYHYIQKEEIKKIKTLFSVYNAEVGQTDSTPFITASSIKIDTNKIERLRYCAINRKKTY